MLSLDDNDGAFPITFHFLCFCFSFCFIQFRCNLLLPLNVSSRLCALCALCGSYVILWRWQPYRRFNLRKIWCDYEFAQNYATTTAATTKIRRAYKPIPKHKIWLVTERLKWKCSTISHRIHLLFLSFRVVADGNFLSLTHLCFVYCSILCARLIYLFFFFFYLSISFSVYERIIFV